MLVVGADYSTSFGLQGNPLYINPMTGIVVGSRKFQSRNFDPPIRVAQEVPSKETNTPPLRTINEADLVATSSGWLLANATEQTEDQALVLITSSGECLIEVKTSQAQVLQEGADHQSA